MTARSFKLSGEDAKDKECIRSTQARLLAMITSADGKIRDIELKVANAMFSVLEPDQAKSLNERFLEELEVLSSHEEFDTLLNVITKAPVSERISFVKMLAMVAACDGEVHEKEETLIARAMEALKVNVAITQPHNWLSRAL